MAGGGEAAAPTQALEPEPAHGLHHQIGGPSLRHKTRAPTVGLHRQRHLGVLRECAGREAANLLERRAPVNTVAAERRCRLALALFAAVVD